MKKIFSIDRFEEEIAVCISDDGEKIEVLRQQLGNMTVRDVFSAEITDMGLVDISPMPEERDRRIEKNRDRLHRLAKRSKK